MIPILFVAGALGLGCRGHARATAAPFQKGVCYAYTLGRGRGYESPRSTESLRRVRELGAEWVSLTPFAWYRALDDPRLELIEEAGWGYETDDTVRKAVSDARALGLRVLLKPHLWSHAGWVGDIAMNGAAQWDEFRRNHRRVALHFAKLAAELEADGYCIGVELRHSTTRFPEVWRSLIAEVREVYKGPLVYGANWEGEFEQIEFWDALDWIGVQAFFPLAEAAAADLDALRRGAEAVADRVGAVARRFGRPVVLTEVGFRSVRDAGLQPWLEPESAPGLGDGGESQALCFRAILEAFWDRPWFYGPYVWKWESGGVSGPQDYHVEGKPAQAVIEEWFRRPAPR